MTPFPRLAVPICLLAALLVPASLRAQVDVTTNRYDGRRTGANLKETTLTPSNVNANSFGKLYSYPVDGAVYAQPLYLSGVSIDGVTRNVLYIVTMNDKVYAFDADSQSPTPLWKVDFTSPPAVVPVPVADIVGGNLDIVGNVGIQSTPVIDRKTDGSGTLYLVARTKESGPTYVQRLHALDIATGRPAAGSPVTITASVPGTAQDSTVGPSGSTITFNPKMENQRAALALSHGVVLISWAGHHDLPPYHGWVMGYDASTMKQVGAFAVDTDYYAGGIWQGGRAPTIDDNGDAYFATGNGTWDGLRNFGDSLLRFKVSTAGMSLYTFFTPSNEQILSTSDHDLSGSGFTLLPGTNLLLGGGKEGVLYLLDANNLGGKTVDDHQVVQKIVVNGGHVMGGPVYWDAPVIGPMVYNWSEDDVLVAYRFTGGVLTTPYAKGAVKSPGHPGGSLTVSANGSTANTGIVWASMPTSEDAISGLHAGILRAYHAETLAEIWTSEVNPARDRAGTLMKFVPPLVVAGRVFMPNQDNAVSVYGLLPPDFSVAVTPAGTTAIAPGASAPFQVAVTAQGGFAGRVDLSATGAPAGITVTITPASITGTGVATMTVAVAPTAPLGAFNLTVTGTGATGTHAASPIVVNVTAKPDTSEIVMWAANHAVIKAGTWQIVDDATAAGGRRLEQPDAGAPKVSPPLAAPQHYVELTFDAQAGRGYRLWMRGRAQNDNYNNDSVWVQFDQSVDANGAAVFRTGTAQATPVIIEECSGCGLSGWGWADNGYGTMGPLVYFSTPGRQTMRIQAREDGVSIDQIVLSAGTYVNTPPGAAKNDKTILKEPDVPPPSGDVILYASEAPTIAGAWRVTLDPSAAGGARIEHPDAGAAKLPAALANPVNYFELTFTADAGRPYHLWLRGRAANNSWANDSVFVQFDDSVDASGVPKYRLDTPNAGIVTLEDCVNCGVSGWGWQDNGFGAGVMGEDIRFAATGQHRIRVQTREDGFSIDQIVLSPTTYLTTPPGALKNDTMILSR